MTATTTIVNTPSRTDAESAFRLRAKTRLSAMTAATRNTRVLNFARRDMGADETDDAGSRCMGTAVTGPFAERHRA